MVKERYWAVRIESAPKHTPYLMVHPDHNASPALFSTELDAEKAASRSVGKSTECKIVRVEVRELRGS